MNNKHIIPKIIHYCWFGGEPMQEKTKRYIETWRKMCPDYEIKEWNENNFDVTKYRYTKEAHEKEKWAFVSDVCRLEKVYDYGGVYLDVNTEIVQNMDKLLNDDMFIGFEQDNRIAPSVFGAKKRHPIIKRVLEVYRKERLVNQKGEINYATIINDRVQPELLKIGLKRDGKSQKLNGVTVYSKEYFQPRYWNSPLQDKITKNTYTIHYFGASWHDPTQRKKLNHLTTSKATLVSVIIPVFNVNKYIDACVESVINQSYENVEVVIVDDGSSDGSGKKCDAWARRDERVKVIHKKNGGLNYARRDGFKKSTGEYITFLDSDDLFYVDNVKNSLQSLFATDADLVAYCFADFTDADENIKKNKLKIDDTYVVRETEQEALSFYLKSDRLDIISGTVWGKLYRRDLVDAVEWEKANFRAFEDMFWTPQVFVRTNRFTVINQQLYMYRRNLNDEKALSKSLLGNTLNRKPIGYLEFVERLTVFLYDITKKFNLNLEEQIRDFGYSYMLWRVGNLMDAGFVCEENNLEYFVKIFEECRRQVEVDTALTRELEAKIIVLESLRGATNNLIGSLRRKIRKIFF